MKSQRRKIVIIGAGGHGKEVLTVLKDQGRLESFWGFVDDAENIKEILGFQRLGSIEWLLNEVDPEGVETIVAIGNNTVRKKIVERLTSFNFGFFNAISPYAYISPYVRIEGRGVMIFAGAVINGDAIIKNHVIVNISASISHDSVIDDFANINPGAHVAGGVYVGKGAFVGMGANVIQYKSIGDWSVIGAGAVVIEDVPPHVTVVGVPAKIVKKHHDLL